MGSCSGKGLPGEAAEDELREVEVFRHLQTFLFQRGLGAAGAKVAGFGVGGVHIAQIWASGPAGSACAAWPRCTRPPCHGRLASMAIMSFMHRLGSTQRLTTASYRPGATWRSAHRLALAGLFELRDRVAVSALAAGLAFHPLVEVGRAHAVELEAHAREARAAVVGGEAFVLARLVDHGVQLGLHGRHGVDLAGQRGDVERVHHRGRRDLEGDRHGPPAPPARSPWRCPARGR
jgi:hypothetical protein